ncbi:MAG: SCP2 sterol-binding domain-containing protein [Actinomycetota bacterium]
MATFLTDAWFAELETRAANATPPSDMSFALEQVIDGDAEVRWQVRIADGAVRIARDSTDEADVRIRTDQATATGIHAGEISAQRAFLDGRLRIGGDVQSLMAHREVLTELGLGLA